MQSSNICNRLQAPKVEKSLQGIKIRYNHFEMEAKKNYLNGHVPKESPLTKRPHLSSLHSPRFSNYIAAHSLEELTIYT